MPGTGRTIKALIADPSEKTRRSIGRYLRGKGLETVEVSDGSKALAEALLGHPDILLLDMSVGVLPPDSLVRILRSNPNTNAIPIFFLSDRGQSISGFRPGTDEFIRKPAEGEEILVRIQRALFPDAYPGERGFPETGTPGGQPAECEFLHPDDVVRLQNRIKEGGDFGDRKTGRIVIFLPDPFLLNGIVMALGQYREFDVERSFFALRRKEEVPVGVFGRIRVGETVSILLYTFPYLRSTSPVWYAVAPRPLGVIAFLKDEVSSSLEGLLAVSDYTRGVGAGSALAVMGKTFTNFGLGENTIRMFRNRIEKLGCSIKMQEMETLSPAEIRDSMTRVVRQYLEGGIQ